MQIIVDKRCIIGECPVWRELEKKLYYVNSFGGNEICSLDMDGNFESRAVAKGVSALAFDKSNRLIVARDDGVFILKNDGSLEELYDTSKYKIYFANDMKIGPDGRIYVGTLSEKNKGISNNIDGKLYSIDRYGCVRILLDGLIASNGLEWSLDEKRFYHTDSATQIIREYAFDKKNGEISYTGRQIKVEGVDGFTIDERDRLYVGCWGRGHIARLETASMSIVDYISVPAKIPTSCAFVGERLDTLAVTTASYTSDVAVDKNAGYTILLKTDTRGRKPYLFG